MVAATVERKAGEYVSAHSGERRDLDVPPREEQRDLLPRVLRRRGKVEEQSPGRFVVRRREGDDLVVLLTPDEWEQVLRVGGPPRDGTFDDFDEMFASTPLEQRFWVLWDGRLRSSIREELPPVSVPRTPMREVKRRLAEARAKGEDFGWYAFTPTKDDELPG